MSKYESHSLVSTNNGDGFTNSLTAYNNTINYEYIKIYTMYLVVLFNHCICLTRDNTD